MNPRHHINIAAALAASVALGALSIGLANAQSGGAPAGAKEKIVAPGGAEQAPSSAPPGLNDASGSGTAVTHRAPPVDTTAITNEPIPTTAELRAALLSNDSGDAAIGQVPAPAPKNDQSKTAGGDTPSGGKEDHNQASSEPADKGGPSATPAETTGTPSPTEKAAADKAQTQTSALEPIGSTTQTLPAKFSKRNDILDRAPMMALPFRLKDDQLRQIYQMAMNDKDSTAIEDANLRVASELTLQQADAMKPLPDNMTNGTQLKGLKFVKTKDRVLLVEPSTRTVVDEISG